MTVKHEPATTAPPEMQKRNSSTGALDLEDSMEQIPEISGEIEESNQFHVCRCCYNLPEWLQFFLYAFFGSLLLLSPLIIMVILDPRPDFLDPRESDSSEFKYVRPYVARWSLFLTLCWISELIIWRLVGAIPRIITSTVFFLTKKSNEKLETIAEFIVALRFWATWALWMVVIQALYTVFFQNNVPAGVLPTDASVSGQYTLLGAIITTVMVFSIVVFIQKFFMHSIAVNFHRSAYSGRIERSKKCVKYIDRLRKSLKRINIKLSPTGKPLFSSQKKTYEPTEMSQILENGESPEKVELNIDIENSNDASTAIDDSQKKEKTAYTNWKSFFPSSASKISIIPSIQLAGSMEVANDRQAKKFAKKLFVSMRKTESDELVLQDFERYFDKDIAKEVYEIFDTDMNGSVTLYELKKGIVEIYRERRAIFRSLQGFSKSFSKLENIFWVISAIITCLFVLPSWGIPLTAILPLTSVFIALGIIVGGALRTMFDCLIFLFAFHPYDAGDRVIIDGDNMIVDNFELLTTTFIKGDGTSLIAPNAVLSTKMIHNIRRSGDQSEGIEITVDFYTPTQLLNQLHNRMSDYVKKQTREFYPTCDFTVLEIERLNSLKCKFSIKHKGNFQDLGAKGQRRRDFMFELIKNLKDLQISYSDPPQKLGVIAQSSAPCKELGRGDLDVQELPDDL